MFERGVLGHATPLLYDPIIHVPLLVVAPGQHERRDIRTPTSNADLLPTILSLAGQPVPEGIDGRVLPAFGGDEDAPGRPIISIEAKESSSFRPFSRATVSMVKDEMKIVYYKGYDKYPDVFEMFDLRADADEKRDLFQQDTATASLLKQELLDLLAQAERPFQPK
jgi:arylsulfatase A-like enzyme